MHCTGHTSTHALSLVSMQASVMMAIPVTRTYYPVTLPPAQRVVSSPGARRAQAAHGRRPRSTTGVGPEVARVGVDVVRNRWGSARRDLAHGAEEAVNVGQGRRQAGARPHGARHAGA